jgi:hypothetical protein
MGAVSWLVDKTMAQVEGLHSVEVVLCDAQGHMVVASELRRPAIESALQRAGDMSTVTVADFLTVLFPSDIEVVGRSVESVRMEFHVGNQNYTYRLENTQLQRILSALFESARNIDVSENISNEALRGNPYQATIRFVDCAATSRHSSINVTNAIAALAGPKSRWWSINPDCSKPSFYVTEHAVVREALRDAYSISAAPRQLMQRVFVEIEFMTGDTLTVTSGNGVVNPLIDEEIVC